MTTNHAPLDASLLRSAPPSGEGASPARSAHEPAGTRLCGSQPPRNTPKQLRKDARARGRLTYYTGAPCKRGHIADHYVSNAACTVCDKNHSKDYYYNVIKTNPELYAAFLLRKRAYN